jgi:hypothetical protein
LLVSDDSAAGQHYVFLGYLSDEMDGFANELDDEAGGAPQPLNGEASSSTVNFTQELNSPQAEDPLQPLIRIPPCKRQRLDVPARQTRQKHPIIAMLAHRPP